MASSSSPQFAEINDIRNTSDFTHCSFSEHKKSDVKKELIRNMLVRKLESSLHWVAELVSAGHFVFLWEIILHYLAKYINIGNPKMPIYVLMRFSDFKAIINQRNYINEIDLRNNPSIRQLFGELICNLSLSNKKPAFEPIISLKGANFNIDELHTLMNSPPTFIDTIGHLLKDDDPRELFTIFTEFAYNISQRDQSGACYWVDWIIQYQAHCIKIKEPIKCFRRTLAPIDPNYQINAIWLLWDIMIDACVTTPLLHKIIMALMNLFSIQYKPAVCERRKQLLFYAVSIITENVDMTVDIVSANAKGKVESILGELDKYYREIKKNEISPKMDYMFMNVKDQRAHNLKMGIAKMEMLALHERM
jgi:hypothetical protein